MIQKKYIDNIVEDIENLIIGNRRKNIMLSLLVLRPIEEKSVVYTIPALKATELLYILVQLRSILPANCYNYYQLVNRLIMLTETPKTINLRESIYIVKI